MIRSQTETLEGPTITLPAPPTLDGEPTCGIVQDVFALHEPTKYWTVGLRLVGPRSKKITGIWPVYDSEDTASLMREKLLRTKRYEDAGGIKSYTYGELNEIALQVGVTMIEVLGHNFICIDWWTVPGGAA